jgi:hypothetical protein
MKEEEESAERFATGEPFSGVEIAAAMGRLHGESERYLATMPAAEFVRPQGEKWSPADHVRHLAKSTRPVALALALPKVILGWKFGSSPDASRPLPVLRDAYRKVLQQPGASAGRFAPAPQPIPEDPAAWQSEVLAAWRAEAAGLISRIPSWSEAALERYRLPHPLLGKLTVREMLFFTLYHNAHHLHLIASRCRAETS